MAGVKIQRSYIVENMVQPAASGKGERAESYDFAGQQIRFLNSKAAPKHQSHSRRSYTIDANCIVVNVEFGPRSVGVKTP